MIYFNDNEKFVVPWLQTLYPDAVVDNRSILDLTGDDLTAYDRVHLFAGIGGWQRALELAGWPDDVPVWTGSCPCQPFSAAGKQKGESDERHLWPEMLRLIDECRPPVIFGEQVASKLGRQWLAGVRSDLEALGYVVGAADLCAAGVGAPHIRQRLYWVAYAPSDRRFEQWAGACLTLQRGCSIRGGEHTQPEHAGELQGRFEGLRPTGRLGNTEHDGSSTVVQLEREAEEGWVQQPKGSGDVSRLGDALYAGLQGRLFRRDGSCEGFTRPTGLGVWGEFDLIECTDGKIRRIPTLESGVFPLADGVPTRTGRLRAYGNSIVPPLAAEFISSFMEVIGIEAMY